MIWKLFTAARLRQAELILIVEVVLLMSTGEHPLLLQIIFFFISDLVLETEESGVGLLHASRF